MQEDWNFLEFLHSKPPPGLCYEAIEKRTVPRDPTCILQHSKTQSMFKNSIGKTALINACTEYY